MAVSNASFRQRVRHADGLLMPAKTVRLVRLDEPAQFRRRWPGIGYRPRDQWAPCAAAWSIARASTWQCSATPSNFLIRALTATICLRRTGSWATRGDDRRCFLPGLHPFEAVNSERPNRGRPEELQRDPPDPPVHSKSPMFSILRRPRSLQMPALEAGDNLLQHSLRASSRDIANGRCQYGRPSAIEPHPARTAGNAASFKRSCQRGWASICLPRECAQCQVVEGDGKILIDQRAELTGQGLFGHPHSPSVHPWHEADHDGVRH